MLNGKMHKCPFCHEIWTFDRLWESIFQYGFINLFSENREIFSFNCPKSDCSSLIQFPSLEPGQSDTIHKELNDRLDPSGFKGFNNRFDYFSSMPFSSQALGIMKTFDVVEMCSSELRHNDTGINKGDEFDKGFYSFCPRSERFHTFNEHYRVWFYPQNSAQFLLSIENNTKIQLLPRYFVNDRLFKMTDSFCRDNALRAEHLDGVDELQIPSLASSVTGVIVKKRPKRIPKKIDSSLFQISAAMKGDETASYLYQILSDDLIDDRIWFDPQGDPELSELQISHDIMLEQASPHFNKGRLNDILLRLVSVFVQDYINFFKQHQLSYRTLWTFKELFLKTLYEACLSEFIFQKKGKPRSDRIVKFMCQAAAQEYWTYDTKITKEEMIKTDEIDYIRKIGAWEDKTVREWLNNLKPKQ